MKFNPPPKYYPERYKCQDALRYAVIKGFIEKPKSCSACNTNSKPIEAHHFNYHLPYVVTWICRSCHKKIHGNLKTMKSNPIFLEE